MNDDGSWKIDFGVGNDQEIADKLGISIRTVEKHIELALRTFKEQLGSFFALFVGWFL